MPSNPWPRAHSSPPLPSPPKNKTTPGELITDPPTLINLGFESLIQGDDNRNAPVDANQSSTTLTRTLTVRTRPEPTPRYGPRRNPPSRAPPYRAVHPLTEPRT